MTEQQIDRLVAQVLQRIQPPVLVLVTAACGYREEIRQRLAGCGERLHLALDGEMDDAQRWQEIGQFLPAAAWQQARPGVAYKALLVPFLDYPLAADVVSGRLASPAARRLHEALLTGIPVLALSYHCNPHSELNQLRGSSADSAYAAHIEATLNRLAACGVNLCTMNELLAKLATGESTPAASATARRYLTVTDIVNNPALAGTPNAVMTDAAADFIKAQRKNTLPR
ncbi:TPA: hypothetical protein ACGEYS_002623 [Kluyvera cryocrescens]|uniref:Flavoprotein n=1 Tax=Kluyvera cryocrescens TaxID=580 RepID=A0AAW9C7W1_KLUCR|nr:hypothetical protein [Kluyvera cryocrescens]MDW3778286.1 hypothetical protein [Kluyvera cryocrescens]